MKITKHPRRRAALLASALTAALLTAGAVAHAEHEPAASTGSTYAPGALLNEGNAQFRAGHPGRAVLDYDRGLLLAPRDPDLHANLDRARAALALPPPPGGVAEAAARVLSPREWLAIFAAAVASLCAALALGAMIPRVRRGATAGALAFALLGSVASASLWLTTRDAHRAVVIAPRAVARVSPFASADTLFTLSEGHTVRVLARYPGHLRVEDGPGRAGWVSQDEVTPIVP
jgi:hypothetical protein